MPVAVVALLARREQWLQRVRQLGQGSEDARKDRAGLEEPDERTAISPRSGDVPRETNLACTVRLTHASLASMKCDEVAACPREFALAVLRPGTAGTVPGRWLWGGPGHLPGAGVGTPRATYPKAKASSSACQELSRCHTISYKMPNSRYVRPMFDSDNDEMPLHCGLLYFQVRISLFPRAACSQ